jgi:phosphatidylserine/phosphatidylglycerophosphate/cardiolipin synthase-like enzyme
LRPTSLSHGFPLLLASTLCVAGCAGGCASDPASDDDDDDDATADLAVMPANDADYHGLALGAIEQATERVHVIEYVIYNEGPVATLLDAMVDAHGRGVEVKLLADEAGYETDVAVSWLQSVGIEAKYDSPETTTHNKLIIVDDRTLVGSHNFSTNAMTVNHESSALVADAAVTDWYEGYFQALWLDSDDDPTLDTDTSHWIVPLKNREIPGALDQCISNAQQRVRVLLYAMVYTDEYPDSDTNRMVERLVQAHQQGIDVQVVLDQSTWIVDNEINDRAIEVLRAGGVDLRYAPTGGGVTHAKLTVCDNVTIVSDANWSYSAFAWYNGTSVKIVSPEVAEQYLEYFDGIREASRVP